MEAGSESSADLILEVPSIYLLYNGSQSGAFLGLVDPYSLNTGVESSGNLRLENGILEPYTLFTGNENGASLITGEVVVQTYVLIAGDESGAVVVTPGYFLLFSGSESGSVLSLGEGITPPYELNTGVESSANIVLGEPSGVVYYLNGGNESSAVVSVLTDLVFDLNTGNESSANLELGEGFVPDPFYSNVSLLLFGNGTDGSTTFVDSGPANRTVTISSGTPIITISQFKYGNGSITGGRIETPYDAAFDWGTGDFTIEFWFRYSGTLASEFRFCTGKTGNFFAFGSRLFSGRRIGVVLENVSWDVELSWTPVGVDTWAHIALTRQGTTMRIFQNGVSLGSASNSRNWNINNSPFLVMPDTNIASGGAWFDDFRVTKGIARYTDTFTPPTGQLPTQFNIRDLNTGNESSANLELGEGFVIDPFYSNVSLLLLGNGTDGSTTFVDSGPANRTVTVSSGSPVITTAQFRYGNGSISGGRVETPYNAAFDWGTGDFTIEFWFRYSGTLNSSGFRFCRGLTSPCFSFGGTGSTLAVLHEGVAVDFQPGWTPVGANTWAHIALTRQGTTMRIFQNGVSLGSVSNSRNWNINNSPFLVMPDTDIASGGAWFDDFRVTKGIARYTANFTPPTEQLPTQ
jgi:hypothetical protein